MSRAEFQRTAAPHLVADVLLYATGDGGRETPALPGWGCPVMLSNKKPWGDGFDALPLLRDKALSPGERRRLGFIFLCPNEALTALRDADRFYLWEGRIIGEAEVVNELGA